jgi:gliding motility-associated-like protein
MKNRGLIFICIILSSVFCYAQKETNYWYFGANAGVTFNSGSPVALTNGALSTLEGCSAISDPNGNLLFYTDGIRVWNRNHVVMTNGNNLHGDPSSTQSGIIVPKPGSTTSFYIFTVDMQAGLALIPGGDQDGFYRGFRYSEVDMTASGGLGAVLAGQKNILLRSNSTEGLTAVKHANGNDVWVIIKGWNNNSYYAYLVTSAGVNTTPVVSSLGPNVVGGSYGEGAIGYMKASPDGNKIAACHSYILKRVIVSDFNTATGQLSNPINILVNPSATSIGPYGVEFSNCNEYLYVGESDDFISRIFRYDLNAANIPASVTTFATINGPYLGALQLALDGKIYVAYSGATHLQAINNPRLPTATFQPNAVPLGGRTSRYGLPPFITSFFNNLDFSAISNVSSDTIFCLGDTTLFSAQISSYDSIRWYFGDPASGPNNTSTLLNPSHYYASPGTYTATLYKYQCSTIDSIKRTVNVRTPPVFNIPDTVGCSGTPITLNPGIAGATYNWSTGQSTQTAVFNSSGGYSLTVTQNLCSYTDNFNLTFNTLPSATITPGGPTTFCSSGTVVLSAPAGMAGYQWFLNGNPIGGQTSQTYTASASGSYTVRVENNNCFNTSPARVVTVNSSPTVTVTPAGSLDICSGNTTTLTITTGGLTGIAWYRNGVVIDGQTTSTLTVNTSGSYYATGQSAGCTGTSNTVVVNVSAASPAGVSISASSNPICAGTPVTFTATPTNGGAAPAYQWLLNGNPVGSNSPTYTNAAIANGNQVQVRMTSSSSCATGNPATSNTITMTVNPAAPITVSISASANNICSGTAVTFTATPTNGGAAPVYQWLLNGNPVGSNSPIFNSASLANGDQVRVQLSSNASCATGSPTLSNILNIQVNGVLPVSVSITASENPICAGTAVTFTATPVNGGTTPAYQWFLNNNPVGNNSPTYINNSLSNGDQLSVVLSSSVSCPIGSPAASNVIDMAVNPIPVVDLGSDQSHCEGTQISLDAGTGSDAYIWNTGETTNSINIAVSGNYSVVVVQNGCSASDAVSVSFNKQLPPLFSLGQDTEICEGDVLTLRPPSGSGYTYLWQDGSTSSTYAVTDSGFYFVAVENECGSRSDSISITTDPCIICEIFFPTAFSPNNDGVNDTFFPLSNCEINNYRFVVYNRWNELLFESNQVGEGWNGTYKGVSQPVDVYIYHISYTFPEVLQPLQHNGIINLLR